MSTEAKFDDAALSFAQERLWFLNQMAPSSPYYNLQIDIPLPCMIDEAIWHHVIAEIIRRHEILRTTFHSVAGQPVQRVSARIEAPVTIIDLRTEPEDQRLEILRRLSGEDARRPFDLTEGPLFRVTLAKLDDHSCLSFITMHHIITDGWSMDLLTREISVLYDAFATGQPSPLPDLPIQYADFAVWQREKYTQTELDRQLAYWREQLEGYQDLELPTDWPRPAETTYRGGFQSSIIGPNTVTALRNVSQTEGATLFMTLLAAFQVLMIRYSGQDDIIVGTPIANRMHPETESLIGFFVNTLVIRGRLAGRPTFREFLRTIRETALNAYSNQDLPFEKLVEELQPRRDLSRNPIFQVMFVMQSSIGKRHADASSPSQPSPAYQPNTAAPAEITYGNAKFDLTLYLTESEGSLHAILEYSTDLFADETITRLIRHWETLLHSIATKPDTPVTLLPMLPPQERSLLLTTWNQTSTEYPRQATIGELFARQVEARPDAVALSGAGSRMTYRELEAITNRLARWLQAQGVLPGDRVGIQLPRSMEMVIAVLAAVKSGGAYLPLDPSYPPARLQATIADAQPRVTLAALPHDLPEDDNRLIPAADAETIAYVLYTSGSTGKPKGVCVSHRNVVRLVRNTNYCEFRPDDVFLMLAPLQFDASTFEIWGALLNGATLEIAPAGLLGLDELANLIERAGVSTLWLTASLFHRIVESHIGVLGRVRQLLAGGDILAPASCQRVIDELPDCTLINGYGPTETTTFATFHRMRHGERVPSRVPIGRPISNARLYVLDPEGEIAPIGVPGELYIGGDGVACGYLADEPLTASRFITDPFAPPGSRDRLYRSGDRVRYHSDGVLEFLGRRDHQIKLRGFRIELGEIEAVMRQHPLVSDACVVVRDVGANRQLVGYAELDDPSGVQEVRRYLQQQFPDYMVPGFIISLPEFPLTENGKLDRRALPEPDKENWTDSSQFKEPKSEMQRLVAAVWCEVLGLPRVGLNDNFFDLGGHSLLLVQAHSRLTALLGSGIAIVDLFRFPTVETLAEHLTKSASVPDATPAHDKFEHVDERIARQREARAQRIQRRRG